MEGDHNTHGAPLPPEEISATKQKLNLDSDKFTIYQMMNSLILENHMIMLDKKSHHGEKI